MNGEEQVQTIQFYKIQLMEKEREISDFDSKLKKIEFKHNREVKEAKAGEERAKGLLKEEKARVDKLSKQANENQEQNNLLQMRLAALKEEKEKEILEVRAQYNSIKEEVRSYERILPTHTFLTEIAMTIEQLPTYEDIFTGLKERIGQHSELQQKFQAYKVKMEESINVHLQNEELLKSKKLQAERNLNEVLPKIIEYQHQISDLKLSNEEYQNVISDLRNEIQTEKSKVSALEDSIRDFQGQVQQMRQAFNNQLHNKQEEVRLSFQEEMERYEQQIKSLLSRIDIKDNMYISQIHILEEENTFIQTKAQTDKQRYEEALTEVKEAIQTMKTQLEKARYQNDQLNAKNAESVRNLLQVASQNQQLQQKLKGVEKKMAENTEIHVKSNKEIQEQNLSQIQEAQSKFDALNEDYKRLKDTYSQLLEERQAIKEENQELRHELNNQKSNTQVSMSNNLDLPNNFQYEQKYRRKSTDYDKYQEQIIVMQSQQLQLDRQKEKTTQLIRKAEDIQQEKSSLKLQLHNAKMEIIQLKMDATELENSLNEKNKQIEDLLKEIGQMKQATLAANSNQSQKLKLLTEEKERLVLENSQQKEKIANLSKNLNENEILLAGKITKQNLLKTQIQSLEEEMKIIAQEDKKNKDLIKAQKEELKTSKEAHIVLTQKSAKEIKELSAQIEQLKQERDQLKSDFSSKEKTLAHEIAVLKNNKDLQEKLKSQISRLNEELSNAEEEKNSLSKRVIEITKELQALKKQVQKLQLENIQKDRQNELINLSLDRERRERTLRTVPSLQSLQGEEDQEQENFNDIYLTITRKEGEINILQRQISDLKEEIESLKLAQTAKIEAMESQQNEYIQTIILMKVKCAESEMKASEKEYLYNQLKKKMNAIGKF